MNTQNATRQTIFTQKGSSCSFKIYIFRRGHLADLGSRKIIRLQLLDIYEFRGELAARCILEGYIEMNTHNATRQTIVIR